MSYQYHALYKPNQIITGTGKTVIITGWTVRKAVAQRLDPADYAAIGNLYSPKRGISLVLRNLLNNPHVTSIIILNRTPEDHNAGACQCLYDFWKNGYTKGLDKHWQEQYAIESEIENSIHIEIPKTALDDLRIFIKPYFVESFEELDTTLAVIAEEGRPNLPPYSRPRQFPMPIFTPQVLPGNRYGHRVEGETIAETWVKLLHLIKTIGTIRNTGYDGEWQELINLTTVVKNEPEGFYFPNPNYLPVDRDFIDSYIPQILEDAPYVEGVKYTYGQRLRSWFKRDQIEQVINKLVKELDAASAVMSLWDVEDHERGGSPCLNHIWVREVKGELSLTGLFRSNDMFAAWVANIMGLRALQIHILEEVNRRAGLHLKLGPVMTISQSAHIYDDTWESVDTLIKEQYQQICNHRQYSDSSGNFVISIDSGEIQVEQTTPQGDLAKIYTGKAAMSLYREIAKTVPEIDTEHAFYLGAELQKAEFALKESLTYNQDQKL